MEVVENKSCSIILELSDIYGVDSVEIPRGFKFKDFRVPIHGEILLSPSQSGTEYVTTCYGGYSKIQPRIILEPQPIDPKTTRTVTPLVKDSYGVWHKLGE